MKKISKFSPIFFVLLFVAIINYNVRCNALEITGLKEITNSSSNSDNIIEYDLKEDTYIEIDNISLETAIDDSCQFYNNDSTEASTDCCNQVTGSITQISTEDNSYVSDTDNSTLYYLGSSSSDGDNVLSSTDTDASKDYYVENWQEIEGELSIKVNKLASCVTVYKGDTPIRAMVCSAGESTPEGTFNMEMKWDWLTLVEGQYGRYCSQIIGDYLFHSVPYNDIDFYALDTEMYNQLGTLCSHGCIRLKVEDAKWIYDNCPTGTVITIYSDNNPGPLGKPEFEKIPSDQTWDPTDIEIQ